MQAKYTHNGIYELSFNQEEIDNLAKTSLYISEIEKKIKSGKLKKDQALFESLVDFLLNIRNNLLQISN